MSWDRETDMMDRGFTGPRRVGGWREEYDQHNSWPGSAEEILQRMQDAERLKQVGERFPFEVSPTNEPTGWDRWPERSGTTGDDTLIAHVNADGTAHDYREPGHINFRVPGGVYNPHGVRGSTTYEDGSAKYSKEKLLRGIRDGWINRNYLSDDDRFWPQNTRPGDGSSMTPESQKLYDSIFKESVPQDDTSSVDELSYLNSFVDLLNRVA